MARMDLRGVRTLLDVGCGPGTLALPLAARLEKVVALDYSTAMLESLKERARVQEVTNVVAMKKAWEDDWSDVPVCDIAIASRSTNVPDLEQALTRLSHWARKRAYLTFLVGGHFIDPDVLALVGRDAPRMPDYLYVLGILYQQGWHPRVDFIDTPSRLADCADFEDFAQRVAWSVGSLEEGPRERLRRWYEANPERARAGGRPLRWAFIGWDILRK